MKNIARLGLTALLLLATCTKKEPSNALHVGDMLVRLSLDPDPPRAGENILNVELQDAQGRPIDGAQLGFVWDMPAMGSMPEMKGGGDVKALGGGKYQITYPLSMPGDWTLTLGIDAPGHAHAALRFKVSPPHQGYSVESSGAIPMREGGRQGIEVAPERQQLIGVVFATVEKRPLSLSLRAPGRVEVDETQVHDVVLKYDAYVEQLLVDQTGQHVRAGQPLLVLYSPELLSSERDYLVAVKSGALAGSDQLVRAAEERLRLWGLSNSQLAELRKRGTAEPRVTIRSPADGTVLEKNVVAGTKAMAGNALYRIGNLGRIWVLADLFESDAPYVRAGLPATMTLPYASGASWRGTVQFVYPTVDEKTRSLRARLAFPNARLALKPGMFADVTIEVPLGTRLAVPDNALLASGEHRYAFVKRRRPADSPAAGPEPKAEASNEGQMQAVEVKIGALAGDYDEVLEGLVEGDEVATQATFLLSSEAQLRSALPRWSNP
jgi:Cu(I)/Ag(I) efflux system membrane fusion protein